MLKERRLPLRVSRALDLELRCRDYFHVATLLIALVAQVSQSNIHVFTSHSHQVKLWECLELSASVWRDSYSHEWQRMASTALLHIVVVGFHHKKGCQVGATAVSYLLSPVLLQRSPLMCAMLYSKYIEFIRLSLGGINTHMYLCTYVCIIVYAIYAHMHAQHTFILFCYITNAYMLRDKVS